MWGGYALIEWILGCLIAGFILVIPFGGVIALLMGFECWWTRRKGEEWRLFMMKAKPLRKAKKK